MVKGCFFDHSPAIPSRVGTGVTAQGFKCYTGVCVRKVWGVPETLGTGRNLSGYRTNQVLGGTFPVTGQIRWDEKAGLPRDAIRSQCSTCSRHKEKETGNAED